VGMKLKGSLITTQSIVCVCGENVKLYLSPIRFNVKFIPWPSPCMDDFTKFALDYV
jgi:hypothetical protein